jgi:transposase
MLQLSAGPTSTDDMLQTFARRGRRRRADTCGACSRDRLSSHKVAGVRQAIEGAGACLLYLPPYSPDLNPIWQVFAKLKDMLRARVLRTVPGAPRIVYRPPTGA